MKPSRLSIPRLLAAAAMTALALSPAGCEDKTPSAVVLVIQSDLVPGQEITSLEIEIQRAGNVAHIATYDVGSTISTFPATITLQDDPARETPLDVRAEIRLTATTTLPGIKNGSGSQIIERTAQVTFAKEQTKTLFLNLAPGCVGYNLSSCGQQNATCGNSGCVSNLYDGAALPVFSESFVIPDQATCFNHTPTGCFQGALAFTAKQEKNPEGAKKEDGSCQIVLPKLPQETLDNIAANLNVAVVWASTSARYTLLNREDFGSVREGWALKTSSGTPEINLAEGLCNGISSGEITHFVFSTTCPSKRIEQPTCKNPTLDSLWAGFTLVDGIPVKDCTATEFGAGLATCEGCLKSKKVQAYQTCLNTPGCVGTTSCAANCTKGDVPCFTACFATCNQKAAEASQALLQEAPTACPVPCTF